MYSQLQNAVRCLACWLTLAAVLVGAEPSTPAVIVPVFSFGGQFTEAPMGEELLFAGGGVESFYDLIRRLKKATADDKVKAVVLLVDQMNLGRAQLEEVRQQLAELKKGGKEIIAHADQLQMSAYWLVSQADRIQVTPDGDLWLTGLFGQSMHVRGLLDKLHITPDFLSCGEYKSAGELFLRTEPSEAANENLTWLTDSLYATMVQEIAEGRGVSPEVVRGWIDHGLYGAKSALEAHVIDAVAHRQELNTYLKDKYGESIKVDYRYGRKSGPEIDLSSPLGVMKFYGELLSGGRSSAGSGPAIAVVYVEGPIMSGSPDPSGFPLATGGVAYSTPISKAIDKAAADPAVKGLVLRVDSPGGSAVGSEVILAATKRFRAQNKPFAVSMGNVAGSGGYYVACASDTVFAEPTTITASIGVIGGKLATKQMWENFGVTFKAYERGANAGILFSGEPFTAEQRVSLQSWMDEVYEIFQGHVLAARRDKLKKDLDQLAGGRVFTGQQALEHGLVDRLGGMDDTIRHVAELANIEKYDVRVFPKPKNLAELLQESLSGGAADAEDGVTLSVRSLPSTTLLDQLRPMLSAIDPQRARVVVDSLQYLDILQRENVSLHMPGYLWLDR